MKTPRNVSGPELLRALRVFGYERIRQDRSHIRLTTQLDGEFHITVPDHHPIKIGTLKSILKLLSAHHGLTVGELLEKHSACSFSGGGVESAKGWTVDLPDGENWGSIGLNINSEALYKSGGRGSSLTPKPPDGNSIVRAHMAAKAVGLRKDQLRQRLCWARVRTRVRNGLHALLDRQNGLQLPQCADIFGKRGMTFLGRGCGWHRPPSNVCSRRTSLCLS